jgi:hypothetical protein
MINVCQVIIIIQSLLMWDSTKMPSPIFKVAELLIYFQLACHFSNVANRLSHLCFLCLVFVVHNATNNQQHLRTLAHEPMSFSWINNIYEMVLLWTNFSDNSFWKWSPTYLFHAKEILTSGKTRCHDGD